MNHSKNNTFIKAFSITLLLLTACDNGDALPKTFDAYKEKTSFFIRDLSADEKILLYQDSFSQNKTLAQQVTFPVFTQCLDNTLKKHSSFMVFYKIYKICEAKTLKDKL